MSRITIMRRSPVRSLLLLVGACVAPLLTGCATNAATGKSQFNTMNREEEIAIGQEAAPQLIQEYGGRINSPALESYVGEVGMKMAVLVEDPAKRDLPWEFIVLDSDVINAFALPGGKVFVSRGLLEYFGSEAELAGVLGHEIGHVTAEHAEQRMGQTQAVNIGGAIAGIGASIFGGGSGGTIAQATQVVVGVTGQGFLLKFSRNQESESDSLGLRYMVAAGYDPEGMIRVLNILKAAMEGGRDFEMLSTHPYPETRLERVTAILATEYPGRRGDPSLKLGEKEWASRARPSLPGSSSAR